MSPAPPGYDKDVGAVKALACSAVDGCVVSESIFTINELLRCIRLDLVDRDLSKK